jgi:transcriptional regulator with XRE-family HTH domain
LIVANIKSLCDRNNVSVSRLEKELGFGNSTIAKWVQCSPTVDKLQKVAAYFGCTVDELLKDDERAGK